jgi:hypothetical protein
VPFAAAITVREHVLRTALQAAYANGSDSGKTFVQDLSGGGITMKTDLFLGPPEFECEGATNLLVATLPMWGAVTVTLPGQAAQAVDMFGEIELTLTAVFRGGFDHVIPPESTSSLYLDQVHTVINARRWTATVTSPGTPPDIAAVVTGEEFRTRFETTFRQGVFAGQIRLPSIDAAFLGPLVRLSDSIAARVRSGALLIGFNHSDDSHDLTGDPETLQDFAGSNDVAGSVHPDAVDLMLDDLHTRIVDGAQDEGATLERFSVRPSTGYFAVSGAVSNSEGTVNFTFRVVPSMFHTRPGRYFQYVYKPRHVNSRTWPALGFHIEDVETDVDRSWWVILFGEVILGILTVGLSILYVEGLVSAAASSFSGQVTAAKPGAPAARIRRTIPPPGGIGVRIGLEQFDVTESGVFIGVSVRATPSTAVLVGPTTVPSTYRDDTLRYIVRPPSGVTRADPALRIRWTLTDGTSGTVLQDFDAPAAYRLTFDFSPASASTTSNDFTIVARLYRQLGVAEFDLGTQSANVHIRSPLPSQAYVRWRWSGSNPQISVDEATDTWTYAGDARVDRYSEWHRTDAPCRAVNAFARYRYDIQKADKLPFTLRLLENHRKGLCPYCFFGGPAGVNANL